MSLLGPRIDRKTHKKKGAPGPLLVESLANSVYRDAEGIQREVLVCFPDLETCLDAQQVVAARSITTLDRVLHELIQVDVERIGVATTNVGDRIESVVGAVPYVPGDAADG